MKASKKLIKFYKGCVVEPIQKKIIKDGTPISMEEVDTLIKSRADIDMSCIQMSNDELGAVIREGFLFGDEIGLKLDFPPDELDDKINLKI